MSAVAITGIGVATPAGTSVDEVWESVDAGKVLIREIDRFDAGDYDCRVAGHTDFEAADHLPRRFVKRTDRFTHLAMFAVQDALADAGVAVGEDVAPERVGVMVGNVLGGWEFAERELRNLWVDGPRSVSPYQATAWFPAAPQGNICIEKSIKGPSRTFVADRASGAYALIAGAEAIVRGRADVVLAGGVEAPLSPYAWLCLQTSGLPVKRWNGSPQTAYRPFDAGHRGSVFGEGGAFLVLENLDRALDRGATVHGRIDGWATTNDGYMPYYTVEPTGSVLARAMSQAMAAAAVEPAGIGSVFAHGSGVPVEDVTEVYAMRSAFGDDVHDVPVSVPKTTFGHLLGAAAPVDVVIALQAMKRGRIPASPTLDRPAPGLDLDFVRGGTRQVGPWERSLVVSRGLGGSNACLVVTS